MNFYTERMHAAGCKETLAWEKTPPCTAAEWFRYGAYCKTLYLYKEALSAYEKSANGGVAEAFFHIGQCFLRGWGTQKNVSLAKKYFERFYQLGSENLPRQKYYFAMGYRYGYGGMPIDLQHAWELFQGASSPRAEVLYEQGLFFCSKRESIFEKDDVKALFFLRQAFDLGDIRAAFAMEELFYQRKEVYPLPEELVQVYAWRLGRLLRAAEAVPCSEYWQRLSKAYQIGFPQDSLENKEKFLRLSRYYADKAMESEKNAAIEKYS